MSTTDRIVMPLAADAVAQALARHADYRVLKRLRSMRRTDTVEIVPGMMIGCAIDVETTGLDHRRHRIIELALQRFWATEHGRIVMTGRPLSWLEDPGVPIEEEITRLTGIRTEDVTGQRITDPVAATLIADADFVVAHNAGFDRPFVESRLPFALGRPWVCSMRDIDWKTHGFEGRTLSHLLTQMGWFYDPHRAQTDVTALLHLLDHPLETGGTVLKSLVKTASQPSWRIEAIGAPFAAKDILKTRGYRWDPEERLWSRDVGAAEIDAEVGWATMEIYGGLSKPDCIPLTWESRYAAR